MESYRDGDSPPRHTHSGARGRSPRRRRSPRKRRRSRTRSRSRSRSRTRTRSRHRSDALLRSAPFTVRSSSGRPPADWVCGVCSNPNSAQREACFRCGTAFAASVAATPSEEIRVADIPPGITFDTVRDALASHFAARGEACDIVAYAMEATEAFVRFAGVAEATRALTYARSSLLLDGQSCAMSFSVLRRATSRVTAPSAADPSTRARVAGLPETLQRGVWKAVDAFESEAAEKAHLDELSRHWGLITQVQKDYYDERVRRALAAQRRTQQQQQKEQKELSAGLAQAKAAQSEHASGESSLASIRRRLAEKRQAVQGAQEPSPPAPASSAASLRERLAAKRADLMVAKAPATAPEAAAEGANPKAAAGGAPGAASPPAPPPMPLFFGFPVPPRFLKETDSLVNAKFPSLRAGVILRYVSPAVAERIVSPSLGPKEDNGRPFTR